jgi:hypothetical protein
VNKKNLKVLSALLLASGLIHAPAFAQARSCEELKSEIEAKITSNGATGFSLTIVAKDAPDDGKVVGTCEGGTKKILYKRGT